MCQNGRNRKGTRNGGRIEGGKGKRGREGGVLYIMVSFMCIGRDFSISI